MNYRAIPHSNIQISPAEALMGRKIRTQIPILESQLQPKEIPHDIIKHKQSKLASKRYFDNHHGAKTPLQDLSPGDQVSLRTGKTWSTQGHVVAADQQCRAYLINTPSGVLRRNRQRIQKTQKPSNTQTLPQSSEDQKENPANPLAQNIQNSTVIVIKSPPTSPTHRRATRLRSGFNAAKPARFREEEEEE